MAESPAPAYMADFLSTAEGLDLMKGFVGIKDVRIRRRIVDLVRALASSGDE
jgi:hypothetical protein